MPQGRNKKRGEALQTTIMLFGGLEVIAGWIRLTPEHRILVREMLVKFLLSSWEFAAASFQ